MLNITKSMELSNMIKESEWFCAIEGIAIAERIYNIYVARLAERCTIIPYTECV